MNTEFQLTLPVWGATNGLEGFAEAAGFQLTLPVWGATAHSRTNRTWHGFQLTLPVWGATAPGGSRVVSKQISTHAPRVGSDGGHLVRDGWAIDFNSRSPCGERQIIAMIGNTRIIISTHAPRVGSDR